MLADTLKETLGSVFTLYFKAHSYHWNVEGPNFSQFHDFLGEFYEEVYGSVDPLAELIRTLDVYAPVSLARLMSMSKLDEAETIPDALTMISNLRRDNDLLLAQLLACYDEAEKQNEFGISNFLQDRIQAHEKHAWMLRSFLK